MPSSVLIKNIRMISADYDGIGDIPFENGVFGRNTVKAEIIDGSGLIAIPGFIDTHIHGYAGFGTEDSSEESILGMSKSLIREGVTTFFPTIYTDEPEKMLNDISASSAAIGKEEGSEIGGIHVEGPFISPEKIGAQNGRLDPDAEIMNAIIKSGNGKIRAMTLAPELPGIEKIIKQAKDSDIVTLMGHTNASYEDALKGMSLGVRHVTHLFNASSPLRHRNPGVVGCALMSEAMTVELIVDGEHVNKDLVKFVIKTKGSSSVAAITDSLKPTGQKKGPFLASGTPVALKNNLWVTEGNESLIRGSSLTMLKGFRNLVSWGVPIKDAVRMTSETPARIYSLKDRGGIEKGKIADLLILDENLDLKYVFKKGVMHVV